MENAAETSPLSASSSVIFDDDDVDDVDDDVLLPLSDEIFVSDDTWTGLAGTRISSAWGFVRMVDGEYVDAGLDFFVDEDEDLPLASSNTVSPFKITVDSLASLLFSFLSSSSSFAGGT
eukprot:CAMPEP_0203721674 /NCGR_PEP_ID=MMETSP0092-20131115/5081_1 /ASSEMBLY_ACC=CAM_ASM_001090 /TAXON_ID=426623 /ORGANISM="Chaetoceros affinis, Strain CCMP159" /LENGTH=118 /DNA_ID=CAMNT_0050601625 /DNA_START=600 /DNA_END=956 /DNA_ORIENTATION=-